MKGTAETTVQICFIERAWLLCYRVRVKCCRTIAIGGIRVEVTFSPLLQPLVLCRCDCEIHHADVRKVAERIAIKGWQFFRFLISGRIGRIAEPVEIGSAERPVVFGGTGE